jgi:hypothetical protein
MRAAPPRAPALAPRNHPPTTAATLPNPNPALASLPTSLPHGRGHPTPRGGRRIPRRCGAPRRRARAARTRLLRGVHHRCMEIRGAGRACELRHAPCFCVWRWAGGIGGSHAAPWRMSLQVGAYGFLHLGLRFCIWGFEQASGHAFWHLGILN